MFEKILNNDDPSSPLARLIRQASLVTKLNKTLHQVLPSPLNEQCSISTIRHKTLVIVTASPIVATQMRYQTDAIVSAFNNTHGLGLASAEIKVIPAESTLPDSNTDPVIKREVSDTSSEILDEAANHIDHAPLADALRRLARRKKATRK